jgi:protein O-GlcNAc transferase
MKFLSPGKFALVSSCHDLGRLRLHTGRSCSRCLISIVLVVGLVGASGCLTAGAQSRKSEVSQAEADGWLKQIDDLKSAETELRQAARNSPRDPAVLASLGQLLEREGRLKEAGAWFARALLLDPTNDAIRGNLAVIQWRLGQLREAKSNLESLLKNQPGNPPTVLLLGMVEGDLKNYPRARQLLTSVPALVKQRPESIAALAWAYYQTGEKDKARATLRELEEHPAGPDGIFLGAQTAAQAGDFDLAEHMFTSIWTSYPKKAGLGFELARTQYRANQVADAQATLNRLIGAGYESSEIYNLLGKCLDKLGNYKDALRAMRRAIALDPRSEGNYLDVGTILTQHRRYPAALVMADAAVKVAPKSAEAYAFKGLVENKMANHAEAEGSYARAVALDPSNARALMGLALAQWDIGRVSKAEETFEEGLKRFPRNANFYQEYGVMLIDTGEISDPAKKSHAVALLRAAIRLDGSLSEPYYRLGNLALTEGRTQEALDEFKRAERLNPRSSRIHYAMSRAYARLGLRGEEETELQAYQKLKANEARADAKDSSTGDAPLSPSPRD